MRRLTGALGVLAVLLFAPAFAGAQASIAGQVKDATGSALPGVMVEAASPALIERVRTTITDGTGQYRIELLPPGTYSVTFSLAGFVTVRREEIELTGTFTATIGAELRVATIEETITVTGQAPMVDVQSGTRERVVDRAIIDALPAGRTVFAHMVLIPGVSVAATNQDVGGSRNLTGAVSTTVRGSTTNAQLLMEDGLSIAALVGPWGSQFSFNLAAAQEIVVDHAGAGAEYNASGVRMNVIPRDGGNTFNGTLFVNGTTGDLQGSNFTQELRDAGLRTPDSIRKLFDVNPGFGGPLRHDRVWFYASGRRAITSRWAADEFYAANADDPNAWTYTPDLGRPLSEDSNVNDGRLRLTWQTAPALKVGGSYAQQTARNWPSVRSVLGRAAGGTLSAYEASEYHFFPIERQVTADVTAPLTNRLLVDAAGRHSFERAIRNPIPGLRPNTIPVLEQSTGREYRAMSQYGNRASYTSSYRASVSYITGAHSVKVGINDVFGHYNQRDFDISPVSYRFNNGLPNQITMRALPVVFRIDVDHQFGAYVQDRWTMKRLTLNAGLRYDRFRNGFPEQQLGPAALAPGRTFSFAATEGASFHDLNPKFNAAYDVFGTGRTAVKASLNRSVEPYTAGGLVGLRNPITRLANSTTRAWNDVNRDYVPNCNLLDLNSNGECGDVANRNFGTLTPEQSVDPELLNGWGARLYDWELTAGVQREIVRRVSVDVSYFRRWFGNQSVTDNRTVNSSDFDTFSITAPPDPRLPDGGGYVISGLYNVSNAKFGQTDNIITFAKRFGKQRQMWNGTAVSVNARLANGFLVQGGFDVGKLTNDTCEIRAALPEIAPLNPYCHVEQPQAQFKALAAYTVPRIDVQVSGTFQNIPGPEIAANFTATNTVVAPTLGRNLSGGAANVSVNLVEPGTMYGERLSQLDLRVGKLFRFGGRVRATVNLDVYNALNVDTVLTLNNAYASWLRPQSIMLARFAKLGVQVDF